MIRSAFLVLLTATSVLAAGCGSDDDPSPAAAASGAGAGSTSGAGGNGAGPGAGGTGSGNGGATGSGGSTGPDCPAQWKVPIPPKYSDYGPTYASHCLGTDHQDIAGVEKVVFLGDSITFGTPPTPQAEQYRQALGAVLETKFPGVEIANCSENGARVDDLLGNQIPSCFPGVEEKKTLIIMTMGGNDLASWAEDELSADDGIAAAEVVAADFDAAIKALKDPATFPNGSYVIFANVYEFTDGTGHISSCPAAGFSGLPAEYQNGALIIARLDELYMKTAVETQSDMIFLFEHFCGHGYQNDNPDAPCYIGPDAERWFDLTCIHPNPAGHAEITSMFEKVVDE
ncbi:MAG: SGNH/GDSL hydrolase family protein [Polyangiaceae bacterium]